MIMAKKKKTRIDTAELARTVVEQAIGERLVPVDHVDSDEADPVADRTNVIAVESGRRGGIKGGVARAKKLSKERRSEIARKAAEARWRKNGRQDESKSGAS